MLSFLTWALFWALMFPNILAGPFPAEKTDSGGIEQVSSSLVQITNLDALGLLQQQDQNPVQNPSDNQEGLESSFPADKVVALGSNESEDFSPGLKNPALEIPGNLPWKFPKIAYPDFIQRETPVTPGTNPKDPCPDHTDGIKSLCCDPTTIEYDKDGVIRKVYGCTACMPSLNLIVGADGFPHI